MSEGIATADFMATVFDNVPPPQPQPDPLPLEAPTKKRTDDPIRAEKVRLMVAATKLLNAGLDQQAALDKLIEDGEPRAIATDAVQTVCDQQIGTHNAAGKPTTRQIEAYYDEPRKEYIIRNESQRWIRVNAAQMKRRLKRIGLSTKAQKGEQISEADEWLCDTEDHYDIKYSGALAGRSEGFYEELGSRILITSSPKFVEPIEGDPARILDFIYGLLDDPEHDQAIYLLSWLKIAYESFKNQAYRPGQALVIAGPRDCGKSLLQRLITEILGGRSAKPYQYMTDKTSFNGDLFSAEHLTIEDDNPHIDTKSRRAFGQQIKSFTVNLDHRCHAKGRDAITMRPLWRVSITLNDEPESLLILPPMDDSLEDKMIIFRAVSGAVPEMHDQADYDAIWGGFAAEIPQLLHYLTNVFEIPENMRSRRFGVTHFHHPVIIEGLAETAPEIKLLELIDSYLLANRLADWQGTSNELKDALIDIGGSVQAETRALLHYPSSTKKYLSRLKKSFPLRFATHRGDHGSRTIWTIANPKKNSI